MTQQVTRRIATFEVYGATLYDLHVEMEKRLTELDPKLLDDALSFTMRITPQILLDSGVVSRWQAECEVQL